MPLMHAAAGGHVEAVGVLVAERGAELRATDGGLGCAAVGSGARASAGHDGAAAAHARGGGGGDSSASGAARPQLLPPGVPPDQIDQDGQLENVLLEF